MDCEILEERVFFFLPFPVSRTGWVGSDIIHYSIYPSVFDSYFLSMYYLLHMVLGTVNSVVSKAYKPLTLIDLTFLSRSPLISKK